MSTLWVDVMNNSRVGRYMDKVESNFLETHLPKDPSVVLDIGGGTGRWSRWLVEHGHQQWMLELDKGNLNGFQKHNPDLQAIQGNAQDIPAADNTFDAVIAIQLFGLVYNPERFLREVYRVLKPNGLMFISWTNKTSPKGFIFDLYSFLKRTRPEDRLYFYKTSHRENTALVESVNFKVIDGVGYSWVMLPRSHDTILVDIFATMERGLGLNRWLSASPNVIIAARK